MSDHPDIRIYASRYLMDCAIVAYVAFDKRGDELMQLNDELAAVLHALLVYYQERDLPSDMLMHDHPLIYVGHRLGLGLGDDPRWGLAQAKLTAAAPITGIYSTLADSFARAGERLTTKAMAQ